MDKTVPPIDATQFEANEVRADEVDVTNRLLAAEANAREKANREVDQRFWLRIFSFAIAVLVVIGMSALLWHVSHRLMTLKSLQAPAAYIIAVYVAPIVSMTTLSIALLVASFRKFHDGDEQAGASLLAGGAKNSGLMN